jgi:hypothetical protein
MPIPQGKQNRVPSGKEALRSGRSALSAGNVQMGNKLLTALTVGGALTLAGHAQATTQWWTLGGDGNVSASGTFTLSPDSLAGSAYGSDPNPLNWSSPPYSGFKGLADPSNALSITGATGVFSDVALGLSNVKITGVYANNYAPSFGPDPGIPESFSYYFTAPPNSWVSYDNLFYPGEASPQTCTLPPPGDYGGYFDNYGVMFTLANGDLVDLYSNGYIQAAGAPPVTLPPYGVVVIASGVPNYDSAGGLAFVAPESSTWAMLLLGFAGLGFAGLRTSRKPVPVGA